MADVSIERARDAVREHLSERSATHCERTAATARELAVRHGEDADAAELAGLLHDWSRDDTAEDLLAFAERAGLAVLPEEREHPYLLHARVAADQLRGVFPGISLPVLSAVAAHTVGAVPMTPLDQIVYVADAIEPVRDYPGVDQLRESAHEGPLDAAFAEAYASSVAFVRAKGAPLHPITQLVAAAVDESTASASPLAPGEDGGGR